MDKTCNSTAAQGSHSTQQEQQTLYPNKKGFMPDKAISVGGVILRNEDIEYNINRRASTITIRNTGDRPIQVGSHFHLFEANRYLEFDRAMAYGCHLNIPATTAIRFEPGDSKKVEIVAFGGKQRIIGFNSLVDGYTGCEDTPTYYPTRNRSIHRMKQSGFKCSDEQSVEAEAAENQPKKDNQKPNDK